MKKNFKILKLLTLLIIFVCSICVVSGVGAQATYNYSYAQEIQTAGVAGQHLTGSAQKLYEYLNPQLKQVASGTKQEAKVVIDSETFSAWGVKTQWTGTELDKTIISINDVAKPFLDQFEISNVIYALLHDMPFEMYWYDKTKGVLESAQGTPQSTTVEVVAFTMLFSVCQEYQANGYSTNNPIVDTTKTQTALTALNNAKQIVETYKDLSDYQKINAYKNQICSLVTYNTLAAENLTMPYGNPWQVVYVFDNDSATNVVCEGYAKAFKLLCDLSTFSSQHIKCYTVTGNMIGGTGAGAHMWNIITMDDEQYYLVDITNSEESTVGRNGELFLAGTTTGSIVDGYTINSTTFAYDSYTLNFWGQSQQSILNLNTHQYNVNHPTIIIENQDIIYDGQMVSAVMAGEPFGDLEFSFDGTLYNENLYSWSCEWFTDSNNHCGFKLSQAPTDVGYYWLKVIATNNIDSTIVYVHTQQFQIKQKTLVIQGATANNKVYNANKVVTIIELNLQGVVSGDSVSVQSAKAEVTDSVVGTYSTINVSNIVLTGTDKNNYIIHPATNVNLSTSINITEAEPTCDETFTSIEQEGKTLSVVDLIVRATGVNGETITGDFVWVDQSGNIINAAETEVIKDAKYYYKFIPSNSNYCATLQEIVLWDSLANQSNKNSLLSPENLPKTIEYATYILVAVVIVGSIIFVTKKKNV